VEDLPIEGGARRGVTISWPASEAIIGENDWQFDYEIDVDSGAFAFEGKMHYATRQVPATGDVFAEVAPIPPAHGPFSGGPLDAARSIVPDCSGASVEQTAPGTYTLRAHGKPLVTE
jgi:hypothetical protein